MAPDKKTLIAVLFAALLVLADHPIAGSVDRQIARSPDRPMRIVSLVPASTEMLARLTVPTRWTPEAGLSTVKVTGDEEPGYRLDEIVACSVTLELEPTLAEPVPEPLDVK